jgi:hypothetical protein
VYARPIFISDEKGVLVVNLMRAKFAPKKDYMAVTKTGYVLFEFMRVGHADNKPQTIDWTDKRVFALDAKKALTVTRTDLDGKKKELIFRTGVDNFDTKQMTLMIGTGNKGNRIRFEQKGKETEALEVDLDNADLFMIQKMIDFGFPYMMGWHTWATGKLADDDITPIQPNK